jgi:hypothetical protein
MTSCNFFHQCEHPYTRRIEAGISKFAAGAMTALEAKYQPATDGVPPPNVRDEQFAKDPTLGKQQIERFNDVYKYYDAEIVKEHPGWKSICQWLRNQS